MFIYLYTYVYTMEAHGGRGATAAHPGGGVVAQPHGRRQAHEPQQPQLRPSERHQEGHMTTGHRLFFEEFQCFNTMPCRHMPLLVHF